jgi:hypothetical protein
MIARCSIQGRGLQVSRIIIIITPHVMESLIKSLRLQLSSKARLNHVTEVWFQIQRQRLKFQTAEIRVMMVYSIIFGISWKPILVMI